MSKDNKPREDKNPFKDLVDVSAVKSMLPSFQKLQVVSDEGEPLEPAPVAETLAPMPTAPRQAAAKAKKVAELRRSINVTPKHWSLLNAHVYKVQRAREVQTPRMSESVFLRVLIEILNMIPYDHKGINSEQELKARLERYIKVND